MLRSAIRRVPVRLLRQQQASGYVHANMWLEQYLGSVNRIFREVVEDEGISATVAAKWIDRSSWINYINSYRRRVIKDPIEAFGGSQAALDHFTGELTLFKSAADPTEVTNRLKSYLVDLVLPKAEVDLRDIIASHKTLESQTDLRIPHEWYPATRLMKRNFIYHGGPTNSGKTYQALKRLAEADPEKGGGLYCGPLRLLALEVYDSLNRQGVLTSLYTGQEKREVPTGTHTSSTLEMVNVNKDYDVAVIDEIQMIADSDRGFAWTRAVLGLRAREIHVCGGLEALEIVKSLVETAGDNFTLQRYDRLSTLQIEEQSLRGDYSKIEPGDCIVAFSKADIFSIKREIERKTPYKCAVIYGQLPPETRATQARLFNDENTGYDILVASDAIGMGLNLNIRRTIFHTTVKVTGQGIRYVEPSSIKQIAGRAGRLSSNYKIGRVTTWQEVDLAYVRAVMSWDVPQITSAGIFPSIEQIQLFSEHMSKLNAAEQQAQQAAMEGVDEDDDESSEFGALTSADEDPPASKSKKNKNKGKRSSKVEQQEAPVVALAEPTQQAAQTQEEIEHKIRLSKVMEKFVQLSRMDGRYFLCEHLGLLQVSNWLHPIPLSIADRFLFSNSPVNTRDELSMVALYEFAAKYALKRPVALNIRLSKDLPRNLDEFEDLCVRHNILELYVWLANRFPKYFIELDLCQEQKNFAIKQIETTLLASTLQRDATHEGTYVRNRDRLKRNGLSLPAGDFPHIQRSVKENLSKIPAELMYVVSEASADAGRNNRYGHGFGAGRGNGDRGTGGKGHYRGGRGSQGRSGSPPAGKNHKGSGSRSEQPRRSVIQPTSVVTAVPTKATVAAAPTVRAAEL